jgi:cardiolipin synthase
MIGSVDLAIPKTSIAAPAEPISPNQQGEAGTSSGVNLAPGSDDDGWIVTEPVGLEDGTYVQLFKDGEALHAAYQAIKNAKHRICLEVYIFASDATGRAFADLLCEKAQQGVHVFLIYDSFGCIATDKAMFAQMRRAGVRMEEFNPMAPWKGRFSWRPFNRDHRKLLVVDYDIAWLGGLNIGAEYAGSWVVQSESTCDAWRDTSIGIRGPSAKFFLRAFAGTWHFINHGGRVRTAEFIHGIDGDDLKRRGSRMRLPLRPPDKKLPDLSIFASVPTMDSPLRPALYRLFSEARKSIKLTMAYFAPDDELIDALCKAAKRGVDVRLMLPAKCDVKALLIAARSFYAKLLESKVKIYERQGAVLHAKTIVLDGRVSVVGSTNLDYRSIEYNCEISALIRNETFGRQMELLFDNDIRFARCITLKEWRRRPWADRFVQWMVIRARYLL